MKSRLILFLVLAVFAASCSPFRMARQFRKGSVAAKNFCDTIPITIENGLIIVEAELNKSGKKQRFIFDTGAPNVISPELAASLGLKGKGKTKTRDSQNETSKLQSAAIPEVKIGNVRFTKSAVILIDLNKQKEISCFGTDGIIGANLMNKACWKIDYDKKQIVFSNDIGKLDTNNQQKKIHFQPTPQGTPVVEWDLLSPRKKTFPIIFDTGKNSDIISFRKGQEPRGTELAWREGRSAVGAFGAGNDTVFYKQHKQVTFGFWHPGSVVYTTGKNQQSLLGNGFLMEHCSTIIFDWKSKTMRLSLREKHQPQQTGFYEASIAQVEGKWIISARTSKTNFAPGDKFSVGDEVKSVNGKPVEQMDYCRWQTEARELLESGKDITLVIVHNGTEQKIMLQKQNMME